MSEINIYPPKTVYVESDTTADDPRCEDVVIYAGALVDALRDDYPFCKVEVSANIHDSDYRVYAIVQVWSPNGSHADLINELREMI